MNIQRGQSAARISAVLLFSIGVGTLSACASAPAPEEQISMSRNAVSRAISAEATQYAPLEMKSAQDKLSMMDRALGERNYKLVRTLAEQIEVDANLAERTARTVRATQQLKNAEQGINVLKQEMLQAPNAASNSPTTDNL